MDDDRKKFPRKGGGKPNGSRRAGDGRPKFSGKPRAGGKKPYVKRSSETVSAGERPKRDFGRDDRPRGEGTERAAGASKPFRKGPPPSGEQQAFAEREGGGERKPFAKRTEGDRKPYVRREEGGAGDRPKRDFERQERFGQGPKREFKRDDRPRDNDRRISSDRERPAFGDGAAFKEGRRPVVRKQEP